MSITKRHFDLLQAMGINVWQRRNLSVQTDASTTSEINKASSQGALSNPIDKNKPVIETILIDLEALRKEQIFNDIIHCLDVNSSDLLAQDNQINLGLINWQFCHNKKIEFAHNCLKTPELSIIAHSPQLKKQLWQSIQTLST